MGFISGVFTGFVLMAVMSVSTLILMAHNAVRRGWLQERGDGRSGYIDSCRGVDPYEEPHGDIPYADR
jgi:hypothetical protein